MLHPAPLVAGERRALPDADPTRTDGASRRNAVEESLPYPGCGAFVPHVHFCYRRH
jgi:hypothetical protein